METNSYTQLIDNLTNMLTGMDTNSFTQPIDNLTNLLTGTENQ